MKHTLVVVSLLFLLFPVTLGYAQVTDTPSTLGVKLTSTAPFVYKDSEGYTVVLGEVENTKSFPVNNVKIWAGFFSGKSGDSGESPLETAIGSSLLQVIPAKGKSPFMIKSENADPDISQVSINMMGFNSASQKQQLLDITPSTIVIGQKLKLDAKIINNGQDSAKNVKVHLIGYDAFNPPRVVGISTVLVDNIETKKTQNVSFDTDMDSRATSFKIIAESDNYQSKNTKVENISLESPTKLVTINDIEIHDKDGKKISKIKMGQTVDISSNLSIQFSALNGQKQNYVYYTQVRQFGEKSQVEFLGSYEGTFNSAEPQTANVSWTPEHEGGFFIETFVWDSDAVALAPPGKTVSVILVTP